jgi:hypothetical protein
MLSNKQMAETIRKGGKLGSTFLRKVADRLDQPHRIHGVVQCGNCGAVYDNLNMSQRCPECVGGFSYGCTGEEFENAFADAQAFDILINEHCDFILDMLTEAGYDYYHHARGQDRLAKMED